VSDQAIAVRDPAEFELRLTRLRDMLERVQTVTDARVGSDIAATLRTWAERAHLSLDSVNEAVRVMLEYQRRGGQILEQIQREPRKGAGRPRKLAATVQGISE